MGFFLSPSSILSVFLAVILGTLVAPQLSTVSRTGGRALKWAAFCLGLSVALDFAAPMLMGVLYRLPLPFDPLQAKGPLLHAAFWACLAWSVFGVVQSAPPKGLS